MSLFAFTGAFIRPFGGFIADMISGVAPNGRVVMELLYKED